MMPYAQKLLDLLSNNDVVFYIPPYQRNYEWTEDQCQVFLDDVVDTYRQNEAGFVTEHFFGSVTYFQNATPFGQPNKLVLIDGQQRITTTMLFLAALRDIVCDEVIVNFIDTRYLKNNSAVGDAEYKIKLKQVEADWQAYKHIMLCEKVEGTEKTSAVYINYSFFVDKLTALKTADVDLAKVIEEGLQKFSLITIELEPQKNAWENPQEIFESMNSLGKPLTLADLVRNYLLLGLDADIQENLYSSYWLHIENQLPRNISNYIRDFMQYHSRTSYKQATETNYKELYRVFKDIFSCSDSTTVLKHLAQHADVYSWLLPGGKTKVNKVDRMLADLKYLKVTTSYSFLFGLLIEWKAKKFSDDEIAEILDVFRIYCIRRRILALTQAENKVFPTFVNYIEDLVHVADKRNGMFEILSKQENRMRLPNDAELMRHLELYNFYNFQYCKFILTLIEESITKSRPDLADKFLQIEHVMPQTLTDTWKKELGENYADIHQELVNTIGNLTLIRHNQELGNRSFVEKKDVYENKAGLQIARTMITDKNKWDADSIRARTAWISNYLLQEVLPIPDSMRKSNNFSIKHAHSLSFLRLQIIGEEIQFIADPSITAKVVSDREVEFEGEKWKLSPLTREIQTRRGLVSASGSYQGAQYWKYKGMKLADIM